MTTPVESLDPVVCPRCGYDLRGQVATWEVCCPLHSTCAECGLGFHWGPVFYPERFEPVWSVEFVRSTRRFPIAVLRTILRLLVPWHFWRRFQLALPLRGKRLATYLIVLLIALPVVEYVVVQTTRATLTRLDIGKDLRSRYGSMIVDEGLPSWLEVVSEEVLFPLRHTSVYTISPTLASGAGVLPLMTYGRSSWRKNWRGSSGVPLTTLFGFAGPRWCFGVGVGLLVPLSFGLLPISRRRAKVSPRHLARITIYVSSLLVVLPHLLVASFVLDLLTGSGVRTVTYAMIYVPLVVVMLHWWAATSQYLKMKHAGLVATLQTGLCGLVLLGLLWVFFGEAAFAMIDMVDPGKRTVLPF